jgi:putative nucleotidyltransferase with HDIG domain
VALEIEANRLTELFYEIDKHLKSDDKPSVYLTKAYNDPRFQKFPFDMLYALKNTEQSPIHHPEGNVWNHTLMVVDEAARLKGKSKNPAVLMWAAFLHDIGKPPTTKIRRGKRTSYDHDKVGAELSKEFLRVFTEDGKFADDIYQLIRYHMQVLFVVKDLPFADIKGIQTDTDIKELALLGLCNRLGRKGSDKSKEENNISLFLRKCLGSN